MKEGRHHQSKKDKTKLSKTELVVLGLIANGLQNKEIANIIFRSKKTVEKHKGTIYAKLKVNCAVSMVRVAIRQNYLSVDGFLQMTGGENIDHKWPMIY